MYQKKAWSAIVIILIMFLLALMSVWFILSHDNNDSEINANNSEGNNPFEFNKSFVYRNFSSSNIAPGEQVFVNLEMYVNVDFETDEKGTAIALVYENQSPLLLDGWVLVDNGYGTIGSDKTLAWLFQTTNPYNPLNSEYHLTYVIQAPNTPGTYVFEGRYFFSNSTSALGDLILGDTTITVA